MPVLGVAYDASFDGQSFWELTEDGRYPSSDLSQEIRRTVLEYAGGHRESIRLSFETPDFTVRGLVAGSDYGNLADETGTSGSLVYHAGTVTALLLAIKDKYVDALDVYEVEMTFSRY